MHDGRHHDPAEFYGLARKCRVCLPAVNIHHNFCQTCLNRGYVAACTNCDGSGRVENAITPGLKGTMSGPCHWCGGKGSFSVTKEYYEAHRDPKDEAVPEPQMPHLPEKQLLPNGQEPLKSATL